jgi:transposase-like protein
MKAMARQRSHSIEFKRQVAQEFIAGESLYALSKRHDISRQLIRVWVEKYEAGALDEDAQAADLLQEYEAKIITVPIELRSFGVSQTISSGGVSIACCSHRNFARPFILRNRTRPLASDPNRFAAPGW